MVIYRFNGSEAAGGLITVNGDLYGVADEESGNGTVFEVNSQGHERTLYQFKGGTDGHSPQGNLLALSGSLYGTTRTGGEYGDGTVFTLPLAGKERILHSFTGLDGANPNGSLVAIGSTLYGTTPLGGEAYCAGAYPYSTCGTVFSITSDGTFHMLYRFKAGRDAANPLAGLLVYSGDLYGTTLGGGTGSAGGCGTVFSITPSGREDVTYRFSCKGGSAYPYANLAVNSKTFYGTTRGTSCGNSYGECGTVFSLTTSGKERKLHLFQREPDGLNPEAGLTLLRGTFYGTTAYGGSKYSNGYGTVYRIAP
jgi:uncharacterized repeat protein (TIGR03803 family)